MNSMATIDTSKEAYRKIGINLSDEQYERLIDINILAQGKDNEDIPVHFILMTLSALGLIPSELMREVSNNESADNSKDVCNNKLQKTVGIFKKR